MASPIGIAVVGTGFGARVQVPAFRAAGFDVKALVGRDPERTARRADRRGVAQACTSVAEALALPGVDAVAIASPPATHAALTQEVLDAGRHVLCEKPFTRDTAEAVTLRDTADRAGVVHALGHEFRWEAPRRAIARTIAEGAIGEPRLVASVDFVNLLNNPAFRMPDWYFDADASGGWLGASGSHMVDALRVWLGEFTQVSAATTIARADAEGSEDSFILQYRMRSGAIGSLLQTGASWASAGRTVISGTAGTLVLEGGAVTLTDAEGRRLIEERGRSIGSGTADLADMTDLESRQYAHLADAFRRAIEGREPADEVPLPTFHDGVAAMVVLDAARRSAREGVAIDIEQR
jgi:predicted dehydrogenase